MSAPDALARWPKDTPLAAMLGADPKSPSPFLLLAEPAHTERFETLAAFLAELRSPKACIQTDTPFGPGWMVSIAYHAGHELEPSARVDRACIHTPAVLAARIDSGLVLDQRTGLTHTFGDHPPILEESGIHTPCTLGPVAGLERQTAYTQAVRRVVELIGAGDAFQVNLAHRLSAPFTGSARSLAAALCERLAPWHGFYLETTSTSPANVAAVVSMSPELFLERSPAGRVRTRPMKGTRPGSAHADELSLAPKDRAELAMIVDLMRNDLGRVCTFGSVRVTQDRIIEAHGGTAASPALWQGVATVEGQLRKNLGASDLIRAAFPPGSVTGAPKVRAMQIIDELEPSLGFTGTHTGRGPYCGACGFIGDDGSMLLNVAIRTAIITGPSQIPGVIEQGEVSYPVGAGIVADSDPDAEWSETLDKARAFIELTQSGRGFAEE